MFYFYILRCQDGSLYCGSTNNLKNRQQRHNDGHGSKYVRSRGGGQIIYKEVFKTLAQAMRREIEVKKWRRQRKLDLIKNKR